MDWTSRGRNPLLPPEVCIPDGEAHVFGDRLYVYGSRDLHEEDYCSDEYTVVSTEDMMTWRVHDKSFDGREVPWANGGKRRSYPTVDFNLRNPTPVFREIIREMHMPVDHIPRFLRPKTMDVGRFIQKKNWLYAPDCAERDGKYYLYFCMSDNTEGVAVSDRPEGPFSTPVQMPCGGIDPAVFRDDDGRYYYYWGQFRACGVRLNDDMMSFDESSVVRSIVTEEDHGFHEGSSMRKRNGIYYYVYPCVVRKGRPTCLAYATSDKPLGPFTYRGVIVDNAKCDPESWNIHGSIQEFNGQWYVFYHRSSRNSRFTRRLCAEKIEFNEDGTIPEVKMTSTGAGEPFAPGETIPAWRVCEVSGGAYVDGEKLQMPDGGEAVIRYAKWDAPVRAVVDAKGDGHLEITADGVPIEDAGPGTHELRLRCHGSLRVSALRFENER